MRFVGFACKSYGHKHEYAADHRVFIRTERK